MSTQQTVGPDQEPKPRISTSFRVVIAVVICALAAAIAYDIFNGVESRVDAASRSEAAVVEMAIPYGERHPSKSGGKVEEVVLPGNAQAYVATPIYARTNGYLKSWNFDIGAHVKAGQLLAVIETPEVDRQLDQARADMATAQANYDLAQTTAARYQSLFKTDSVAKQEVDNAVERPSGEEGDAGFGRIQRTPAGRDTALSECLCSV